MDIKELNGLAANYQCPPDAFKDRIILVTCLLYTSDAADE